MDQGGSNKCNTIQIVSSSFEHIDTVNKALRHYFREPNSQNQLLISNKYYSAQIKLIPYVCEPSSLSDIIPNIPTLVLIESNIDLSVLNCLHITDKTEPFPMLILCRQIAQPLTEKWMSESGAWWVTLVEVTTGWGWQFEDEDIPNHINHQEQTENHQQQGVITQVPIQTVKKQAVQQNQQPDEQQQPTDTYAEMDSDNGGDTNQKTPNQQKESEYPARQHIGLLASNFQLDNDLEQNLGFPFFEVLDWVQTIEWPQINRKSTNQIHPQRTYPNSIQASNPSDQPTQTHNQQGNSQNKTDYSKTIQTQNSQSQNSQPKVAKGKPNQSQTQLNDEALKDVEQFEMMFQKLVALKGASKEQKATVEHKQQAAQLVFQLLAQQGEQEECQEDRKDRKE